MCVLLQLPRPTPTLFSFPPTESPVNAAPSLSIHSPGGTGRPLSPALTSPSGPHQPSPGRGYCPVVRGLAPSSPAAAGLGVPAAANAVRSPSVNRLGSLFNSISSAIYHDSPSRRISVVLNETKPCRPSVVVTARGPSEIVCFGGGRPGLILS